VQKLVASNAGMDLAMWLDLLSFIAKRDSMRLAQLRQQHQDVDEAGCQQEGDEQRGEAPRQQCESEGFILQIVFNLQRCGECCDPANTGNDSSCRVLPVLLLVTFIVLCQADEAIICGKGREGCLYNRVFAKF
jgi:hypothetical protein